MRRQRARAEQSEASPSSPAPARSAGVANASTGARALRALQRAIGNRATRRVLGDAAGRHPASTAPPAPAGLPAIRRSITLVGIGKRVEHASRAQVLAYLRRFDREYGTAYADELSAGALRDALDRLVDDDTARSFGFLQAAEIVTAVREEALVVGSEGALFARQRLPLLQEIRKTFFSGGKPGSLLYLGAGADVANPLVGTGASSLTLVDMSAFNVDLIEERVRTYLGPDVQIARVMQHQLPVRLVVTHPEREGPALTIDLQRMGYETYLQEHPNATFDVLFDKDSWLGEAGPALVSEYGGRLNPGGVWVSNYPLGGQFLQDLFDLAGMVEVTSRLQAPFNQATFGNDDIRVYQKTASFHQQLFAILNGFAAAVGPALRYLEPHAEFDDEEERLAFIGRVREAGEVALKALSEVDDAPPALATRLSARPGQLRLRLQDVPVAEEEVFVAPAEVQLHGFQLAQVFSQAFVAETDPSGLAVGDQSVRYRHANGVDYYLAAVTDEPRWKVRRYTFRRPG